MTRRRGRGRWRWAANAASPGGEQVDTVVLVVEWEMMEVFH